MTDKCPCKMTYDITDQLAAAALDLGSRHPQEIIELLEKAKTTIDTLRGYRDEAEAQAAIADMVVSKFRLTFAECETIRRAAVWNEGVAEDAQAAGLEPEGRWHREDAAMLRGLLKRHEGAQCTS